MRSLLALALVALGFMLFADLASAQSCNIGQAAPVRASAINNLALPATTAALVSAPAVQQPAAGLTSADVAALRQLVATAAKPAAHRPGPLVAVKPRPVRMPDNYRLNLRASESFARSGALNPANASVALK